MTGRDRALEFLRQHSGLADLAAFPCDFDLARAEHGEEERLASATALQAVAGDDTSGTYVRCSNGEVLCTGSDGEAGPVGDCLDEALEVLTGLPGWRDYTNLDLQADTTETLRRQGRPSVTPTDATPYVGPAPR